MHSSSMRTPRPGIDRNTCMCVWGEGGVLGGGNLVLGEEVTWSWGGGRHSPGHLPLPPWSRSPLPWTRSPPDCDHVTYPMIHLVSPPPPKCDRMTDACENITFARFVTRAVMTISHCIMAASNAPRSGCFLLRFSSPSHRSLHSIYYKNKKRLHAVPRKNSLFFKNLTTIDVHMLTRRTTSLINQLTGHLIIMTQQERLPKSSEHSHSMTKLTLIVHLYWSESESDVASNLLHCFQLCIYTTATTEATKIKEKFVLAFAPV